MVKIWMFTLFSYLFFRLTIAINEKLCINFYNYFSIITFSFLTEVSFSSISPFGPTTKYV
ncbi:hypothetical protein ACUXCC_000175 [Cytobacillus horneckiae]